MATTTKCNICGDSGTTRIGSKYVRCPQCNNRTIAENKIVGFKRELPAIKHKVSKKEEIPRDWK